MRYFSIIIPVYNRPDELDELLESLTRQSYKNFEVVVIEDGSQDTSEQVCQKYQESLKISYFFKENTGQGFSRNFGFEKAQGDYLVVFDSDCLIPKNYLQIVNARLDTDWLDAYGGPDMAHKSFTNLQKAISYSMTSVLTTGGIRGKKRSATAFHPRSFNMGISRKVFEKTGGYKITRMGEDIEFSIRIIDSEFRVGLIEDAVVYHKRRTSLGQFYKQLHFFGRARINISRFYPAELKLVHMFPLLFTLGLVSLIPLYFYYPLVYKFGVTAYCAYFIVLFIHAFFTTKSLPVAILSLATSFVQLTAYGIGFFTEGVKKIFNN